MIDVATQQDYGLFSKWFLGKVWSAKQACNDCPSFQRLLPCALLGNLWQVEPQLLCKLLHDHACRDMNAHQQQGIKPNKTTANSRDFATN
jgi:hypothetical protein